MKHYQEIKYYGDNWGLPIIAFDKIDGSNLRFEYSHKRGFYKFGTRKMMIDTKSQPFGFAIDLFMNKYADELSKIFSNKQYRNILSFVCYAELSGEKSEFGQHDFMNDKFDITLFDIDRYKHLMIPPNQFCDDFGHTGIPKIVYEGNLNREFISQIKSNHFGLKEGVICKGVIENKKNHNLFYCKVKTDEWFDRLRSRRPDLYEAELKQQTDNQNGQKKT